LSLLCLDLGEIPLASFWEAPRSWEFPLREAFGFSGVFSVLVSRLRAAAYALFPPRGEEEKSEIEAERHSAKKRTKRTAA